MKQFITNNVRVGLMAVLLRDESGSRVPDAADSSIDVYFSMCYLTALNPKAVHGLMSLIDPSNSADLSIPASS